MLVPYFSLLRNNLKINILEVIITRIVQYYDLFFVLLLVCDGKGSTKSRAVVSTL